jgi:hypothetical protein
MAETEPVTVGRTTAWNWRVGARAIWLPWPSDAVIYNAIRDGRLVSVLTMLQGAVERAYDRPVLGLAPVGNRALSLDLRRLGYYRPELGYAEETRPAKPPELAPANDGLWSMNLNSGETRLTLSYSDLHEWTRDSRVGAGREEGTYISHAAFNGDGTRLAILHHTVYEHGRTHVHLITASVAGSRLFCVTKGRVSGFRWMPDGRILVWAGPSEGPEHAGSLRERLHRLKLRMWERAGGFWWARQPETRVKVCRMLGLRYRIFKDEYGEVSSLDPGVLYSEGAPSFAPDGQWMAIDSGADAYEMGRMGLLHFPGTRFKELGRFLMPEDADVRLRRGICPQLNLRLRQVVFESGHEGIRQVYVMDVPEDVFKAEGR